MKYWKYWARGVAWVPVDPKETCPSWWPFDTRHDWRERPEFGIFANGAIDSDRLRYFASLPSKPFKNETSECTKAHDKRAPPMRGASLCSRPVNAFVDMICIFPVLYLTKVPPFWMRALSCFTEIDIEWLHMRYAFHWFFTPRLYAAFLDYKVNFEHERTLRAYNEPWSIIFPALRTREGRRVSWKAYLKFYHNDALWALRHCLMIGVLAACLYYALLVFIKHF